MIKEQEDKTKNGCANRPQLGSGPTYSDSPSDNANSSITSSPTDTLRTSKNSAAKIIKNLSPIKAKIKKFKNGVLTLITQVGGMGHYWEYAKYCN